MNLLDVLSEQWFNGLQPQVVRIRGYQMARVTRELLPERFPFFATARSMVFVGFGPLNYIVPPELSFLVVAPDEMQFAFNKDGLRRSSQEMAHLIIAAPEQRSEDEARFNLDVAAGLAGAALGRNAIFQLLFENLVDLSTKKVSVSTPVIRNPLAIEIPEVSESGLSVFARCLERVADLGEAERNRVRLALHWHEQAARSLPRDEFLKQWIALEAIGMDERSNVRPLVELLAKAYALSYNEARAQFGIGRIFGFRSRIVHRGERLPINGLLQEYVEAVFRDVLFERLGLPCRRFASSVAASRSFNLRALLHEA